MATYVATAMDMTTADQIRQVRKVRPHLVIIGAGASRAALPLGDRDGRQLPVMADFANVVPVGPILQETGIKWRGRNFEEVYYELLSNPRWNEATADLESVIYKYFASLELPPTPTLYDFLVLSLRGKDVIATFNWDPFLIQAYRRNKDRVPSLPRLLFLHGNVAAGFCARDGVLGPKGARCSRCDWPFAPSKLLYPVRTKDYTSDPMIASAWTDVQHALKEALFVTIFGYGAPASDAGAVHLLSQAWGEWQDREFEEFEIIDIRPPNESPRQVVTLYPHAPLPGD